MGCAATRIWRPGSLDRGVWRVHKAWHLEWNTPGSPDGTQGYLVACYRNIVDTKPSHFFRGRIRNQIASRMENRKKEEWPNRKSNRLTKKKKSTYLVPHWVVPWADWCGARFALSCELSCKNNGAVEIQFAVRYFKPNESALRKLCTNINQPYLIWAAVLCRYVLSSMGQLY